jgi:hypothetical protein
VAGKADLRLARCLCGSEGHGDDPGPFCALDGRRDGLEQRLDKLPIVSEAWFVFCLIVARSLEGLTWEAIYFGDFWVLDG